MHRRSRKKLPIVLDGHLDRFLVEEPIHLELYQAVVPEARVFLPCCGKRLLSAVPKDFKSLVRQ
jgi:hypothetical protein